MKQLSILAFTRAPSADGKSTGSSTQSTSIHMPGPDTAKQTSELSLAVPHPPQRTAEPSKTTDSASHTAASPAAGRRTTSPDRSPPCTSTSQSTASSQTSAPVSTTSGKACVPFFGPSHAEMSKSLWYSIATGCAGSGSSSSTTSAPSTIANSWFCNERPEVGPDQKRPSWRTYLPSSTSSEPGSTACGPTVPASRKRGRKEGAAKPAKPAKPQTMLITRKFRLELGPEQKRKFRDWERACRRTYNLCVAATRFVSKRALRWKRRNEKRAARDPTAPVAPEWRWPSKTEGTSLLRDAFVTVRRMDEEKREAMIASMRETAEKKRRAAAEAAGKEYEPPKAYERRDDTVPKEVVMRLRDDDEVTDLAATAPKDVRYAAVRDFSTALAESRKSVATGAIKRFRMQFKKWQDVRDHGFVLKVPSDMVQLKVDTSGLYKLVVTGGVGEVSLGREKPSRDLFRDNGQARHDCKIQVDKRGLWYLHLYDDVAKRPVSEVTNTSRVCALDPGSRKFMCLYDPDGGARYLGVHTATELERFRERIARLQSAWERAGRVRRSHQRRRTRSNIRKRIRLLWKKSRDLVSELHKKIARYLVDHYDVIIIGDMSTKSVSQKVDGRGNRRKIGAQVVANLLNLRHYGFRQHLEYLCKRNGRTLVIQDESYTSKTCGGCGFIHDKLGASEVFKCPHCAYRTDRDINGARNIFLRWLGGLPRQPPRARRARPSTLQDGK